MEVLGKRMGEQIMGKTENGTIKSFNLLEGWGFILDSKNKDVFFHKNYIEGIKRDPSEGEKILFIREIGPKGPRAFKLYLYEQQKKDIYRVLYKRHINDQHAIIFSTGTVDEIKYPKTFEKVLFQKKVGLEWLECPNPNFFKETESA